MKYFPPVAVFFIGFAVCLIGTLCGMSDNIILTLATGVVTFNILWLITSSKNAVAVAIGATFFVAAFLYFGLFGELAVISAFICCCLFALIQRIGKP